MLSTKFARVVQRTPQQPLNGCRFGIANSKSLLPISISTRSFSLDSSSGTDDENDVLVHDKHHDEPLPLAGEWKGCRRTFMAPLRIKNARGMEVLHNPLYNKGTAFKSGERDRLGFRGLLPSKIFNIHLQKERFLYALRSEESNIKKNLLLEDLHDRNETLYHRVLVDHMDEMAPLIYTPTVGQACMEFAARFRRPRGMYFTEEDRGQMAAMVRHFVGICYNMYMKDAFLRSQLPR
jgi:Malic enzyme, N-terminal domain